MCSSLSGSSLLSGGGRLQASNRQAHRGAKRHPAGGRSNEGGVPGMVGKRFGRSASKRGTDPSNPQVYGCRGS